MEMDSAPSSSTCFIQLQFKAKCSIQNIVALALEPREGHVLICDGNTFSLWKLQDLSRHQQQQQGGDSGNGGYLRLLQSIDLPLHIARVTHLYADSDYGGYIALCLAKDGSPLLLLIDSQVRLSIQCLSSSFQITDIIQASVYNQRTHELYLSIITRGKDASKSNKLRSCPLREAKNGGEREEGGGRLMMMRGREVSVAHSIHQHEKNDKEKKVKAKQQQQQQYISTLALDLRTNYLFGGIGSGVMIWDGENGDSLFHIKNLLDTITPADNDDGVSSSSNTKTEVNDEASSSKRIQVLAVLPGSDYIATAHQHHLEKGEWRIILWHLTSDGIIISHTSPPMLVPCAVTSLQFADHGATLRGQPVLYATDIQKRVWAWELRLSTSSSSPLTSTPPASITTTNDFLQPIDCFSVNEADKEKNSKGRISKNIPTSVVQGRIFLHNHPSLQRFASLSSLLVIGGELFGLTFHGAKTSHACGSPIQGQHTMAVAIIAEVTHHPNGVLLVLTQRPNILYVRDRATYHSLKDIILPVNDRFFQQPPSSSLLPSSGNGRNSEAVVPTCMKHIPLTNLVAIGWTDGRVDTINLETSERVHVLRKRGAGNLPTSAITSLTWFPMDAAALSPPCLSSSASGPETYKCPLCIMSGSEDGTATLWLVHAHGSVLITEIQGAHTTSIVAVKPRYSTSAATSSFAVLTLSCDGEMKTWVPSTTSTCTISSNPTTSSARDSDNICPSSASESSRNRANLHRPWRLTGYVHIGKASTVTCAEVLSQQIMLLGLMDGALELWYLPTPPSFKAQPPAGGGGGHHLSTTQSPVQSLPKAHQGRVTHLAVKTASPQIRLVLSSAEDGSVLISTFDGLQLHTFRRLFSTQSLVACIDLQLPTYLPPPGVRPVVEWRVLGVMGGKGEAGGYVTQMCCYQQPIYLNMPSYTSNTDHSSNLFLHAQLPPSLSSSIISLVPPSRKILTKYLCAYRHARLRPTWLPIPDEDDDATAPMDINIEDEDDGCIASSPAYAFHQVDAAAAAAADRPLEQQRLLHQPQQQYEGYNENSLLAFTSGSNNDPAINVIDMEDRCGLPEDPKARNSSPYLRPTRSSWSSFRPKEERVGGRRGTQSPSENGQGRGRRSSRAETTTAASSSSSVSSVASKGHFDSPHSRSTNKMKRSNGSSSSSIVARQNSSVVASTASAAASYLPDASTDSKSTYMSLIDLESHLVPPYITNFYLHSDLSYPIPPPPLSHLLLETNRHHFQHDRQPQYPQQQQHHHHHHHQRQVNDSPETNVRGSRANTPASAPAGVKGIMITGPCKKDMADLLAGRLAYPGNRPPFSMDSANAVGSSAGVQQGLPRGYYDRVLMKAIARRKRDLLREALLTERRKATMTTSSSRGSRGKPPMEVALVGLREDVDDEEEDQQQQHLKGVARGGEKRTILWLDCLKAGQQPLSTKDAMVPGGEIEVPEFELLTATAKPSTRTTRRLSRNRERAEGTARRRSQVLGQRERVANLVAEERIVVPTPSEIEVVDELENLPSPEAEDPLLTLFKGLKGEDEYLNLAKLLQWDRLIDLMSGSDSKTKDQSSSVAAAKTATPYLLRHQVKTLYRMAHGSRNEDQLDGEGFKEFATLMEDFLEREIYPPTAIKATINEVSWKSLSLSFQVDKASTVYLAIYQHQPSSLDAPPTDSFLPTCEDVKYGKEELVESEKIMMILKPTLVKRAGPLACEKVNKPYNLLFTSGLREKTSYTIYFYAEHSRGRDYQPSVYMSNDLTKYKLEVEIPPRPVEKLDIEWTSLRREQQDMEALAASKDLEIIAMCQSQNIIIPAQMPSSPSPLPATDEGTAAMDFNPESTSPSIPLSSEENKCQKEWTDFAAWWASQAQETGGLRSAFLLREFRAAMLYDASLRQAMEEDGLLLLVDPADLEALLSSHLLDSAEADNDDQEQQQKNQVDEGEDEVRSTRQQQQQQADEEEEDRLRPLLFRLRSWYKGGRVMEECASMMVASDRESRGSRRKLSKKRKGSSSSSSAAVKASINQLVKEKKAQRLSWRHAFLKKRVDLVEEAIVEASDIVQAMLVDHQRSLRAGGGEEGVSIEKKELLLLWPSRTGLMRQAKARKGHELLTLKNLAYNPLLTPRDLGPTSIFDTIDLGVYKVDRLSLAQSIPWRKISAIGYLTQVAAQARDRRRASKLLLMMQNPAATSIENPPLLVATAAAADFLPPPEAAAAVSLLDAERTIENVPPKNAPLIQLSLVAATADPEPPQPSLPLLPPPLPRHFVPFREMTEDLQQLELRVALLLPEVMMHAGADQVEVPSPPALSPSPSPSTMATNHDSLSTVNEKQQQQQEENDGGKWDVFTDWYAKAEDTYVERCYASLKKKDQALGTVQREEYEQEEKEDSSQHPRTCPIQYVTPSREAVLRYELTLARQDEGVRRMMGGWMTPRGGDASDNNDEGVEEMDDEEEAEEEEDDDEDEDNEDKDLLSDKDGSTKRVRANKDGEAGQDEEALVLPPAAVSAAATPSLADEEQEEGDEEEEDEAGMQAFAEAYLHNFAVRRRFLQSQVHPNLTIPEPTATTVVLPVVEEEGEEMKEEEEVEEEEEGEEEEEEEVLMADEEEEKEYVMGVYEQEEILGWYSPEELEEDDEAMLIAEKEGRVGRSQELEVEREALEVVIMTWEDLRSGQMPLYQGVLDDLEDGEFLPKDSEGTFYYHDLSCLQLQVSEMDDWEDVGSYDSSMDHELEELVKSQLIGMDNERLLEIRRLNEEEAKRRRDEETRRSEEEERQLRVNEMKEIRQSIQRRLAELKRRKMEEAEKARLKALEALELEAQQEEEARISASRLRAYRLKEEKNEQEMAQLQQQRDINAEKAREARELALMRQEEFVSQLREREDKKKVLTALERLEYLRLIYTPYRSVFRNDEEMEALLWSESAPKGRPLGDRSFKQQEKQQHYPHHARLLHHELAEKEKRRRNSSAGSKGKPSSSSTLPIIPYKDYLLQMPEKEAYVCFQNERQFERALGIRQLYLNDHSHRLMTSGRATFNVLQEEGIQDRIEMLHKIKLLDALRANHHHHRSNNATEEEDGIDNNESLSDVNYHDVDDDDGEGEEGGGSRYRRAAAVLFPFIKPIARKRKKMPLMVRKKKDLTDRPPLYYSQQENAVLPFAPAAGGSFGVKGKQAVIERKRF